METHGFNNVIYHFDIAYLYNVGHEHFISKGSETGYPRSARPTSIFSKCNLSNILWG